MKRGQRIPRWQPPAAAGPFMPYAGPPDRTEPLITAPFTAPTPVDAARIDAETAARLAAALKGPTR